MRLLIPALCLLLPASGCAQLPTPIDYYSAQIVAFGTATDALAEAAKGELTGYRTEVRLLAVKVSVSNYMATLPVDGASRNFPFDIRRQVDLLCVARLNHSAMSQDREFVQGVAKVLKDLAAESSDDYKKLFKGLFVDYEAQLRGSATEELRAGQKASLQEACEKEFSVYADTIYPAPTLRVEAFQVGAIVAAWKEIWGVLKPLVTGALQIADRIKRGEAVKAYFSNPENVKRLSISIEHLRTLIVDAETKKRHAALHAYVRAYRPLTGAQDATANAVKASQACSRWRSRTSRDFVRSDPDFQGCYGDIYSAWAPVLEQAFTAAADYDAAADLPASAAAADLEKVVMNLKEMSSGKPNEELLQSLLSLAISMRDYVKKVDEAAKNEANRAKVKAAFDKIKAELGGKS